MDDVPEGTIIPEEREKPFGTGHALYKITDDKSKLKSYIMFRGGIIWHLLLWLPEWVVDLEDLNK